METSSPAETEKWLTENGTEDFERTEEDYHFKANGIVRLRGAQNSWWSNRSRLEKGLVLLVGFCVALCIALIIALAVVSGKSDNTTVENGESGSQKQEVCTSLECIIAAARVSTSIDFTKDPCHDFYNYACGTWREKNVIPEDKSSLTTFVLLRDEVEVILKNILENNSTYMDHEVLLKPKQLYNSCMNLAKLEERGDKPLRDFLNQLVTWPLLNDTNWDEQRFNLTDLLVTLSLYSNHPLVSVSVNPDVKNSSARILYIDQPDFVLPGRKYYLVSRDDPFLKAYEKLMKSIALELGANTTTVTNSVKQVVDFEIQLANISVPDEDRRDNEALYNKYTLPQLEANFTGAIHWKVYFQGIMSDEDIQIPLRPDEVVINRAPLYISRLLELLRSTSNRTLANYLVWRIVRSRAITLNERYLEFFAEFDKVVSGIAVQPARFRSCASYVTDVLGLAVGHMFVKEAFAEDAKQEVVNMIRELKKAFNGLLDELDWMDDNTKKLAREKNEFIDDKIGYPDEVLNTTYLTTFYENYTYNPEKYFENAVMNAKQGIRKSFRQLREPVDRSQWTLAPSTVNAFYSPPRNQIMFPAGILQPPFYSKTYPKSLNYGGIGVVIGHEITHGFDDRGRQYDKFGNLQQWWDDEAIGKFKTRAQCIINQYGNFTVPEAGMKINGVNTQGENIADNGGLKQSFRAYRNWVKEQGKEEPLLPGLNFTHDQLFFINFAQIWCTNMRRENAINRVLTGVHSPGEFRVIGTLQNSEEFAKAFHCAKGTTTMNPQSKCVVW
ncbi:LOW QUALITY PROTEIN: neprilysin-4-like [Pomacea canaliculata]|uniref:LOW QUALITY PROTEIN: neprilysin-4-like n=1 Tax=Pomacea canaliculata TaxID=400727 RepID=UPI000D73CBB5|nr:LOW QUALITY PROTEIN: neprilysin-4-like [Pomacea canaliculata]